MENEILNKILEGQNEIKGAVEKLQNDQSEIKNTVKQLQNNQDKMQEDIKDVKKDVSDLKDKVNDIDKVVMKMEHEHGDKIQALLDAVVVNNEKYQEVKKEQEERFSNISFKLLSNDVRLDKLEKVVNK